MGEAEQHECGERRSHPDLNTFKQIVEMENGLEIVKEEIMQWINVEL